MHGSERINYCVVRSGRKTVSVIIDPVDGVIVRAPQRVNDTQIQEIVKRKAPWILGKLKGVHEMVDHPPKKEFVSGESFLYLGRNYRLKIRRTTAPQPRIRLIGGRFTIDVDPSVGEDTQEEVIRNALIGWYMNHAKTRLVERVDLYSSKVDASSSKVVVKKQLKRWGSCTKNGILHFNWKIIMAPMSIVDYVVVHELCHLRKPSHSSDFWTLLRSVVPDYNERRAWLKKNGRMLSF